MSTIKEQLRELLEQNRGSFISGEEIAKRLYCTRGAVWKAINALRNDGFEITAATNRGYCLEDSGDFLSESGICRLLNDDREIIVLKSVNSTNAYMRKLAEGGYAEGTIVVSSEQSNGSGRHGRSFFSPADTGLYMSILLRPEISAQEAVKITSAAAVAVCRALYEVCGVSPEIKWVNDIYLNGKKVAGILTEAAFNLENGALDYAILGIGVNVYPPVGGFPADISKIAGAVLNERKTDTRNRLAAAICKSFSDLYAALPDNTYLKEYRKRLMWIDK
ncbi:MAG: biotin--[acetyl-CoA-carboxylase] ligase, partial [Oscillospiraceae bacterium]